MTTDTAAPTTATPLKRKRTSGRRGSLASAQKKLWIAISRVKDIVDNPDNNNQAISATHAMSQSCMAYVKMIEAVDIETRLKHVEKILRVTEDRAGDRA